MINNDVVDNFQSAYKAGHSFETALLECIMILLLPLVEVMVLCLFYLIYRHLLIQLIMIIFFCILEKYVGICGNALKLIQSYFSNRTQRVQIDDVLLDFANIICGVPQGSVLGPLKFCLYLLPMSAI